MILQGHSHFLPNFSIAGGNERSQVKIGNACVLGVNIVLEVEGAEVEIGDQVYIGNSKIISKSKVTFENNILVAWGVTFYDHDSHSLDHEVRRKDIEQVYKDFSQHGGNYLLNKDWSVVNSKPIHIKSDAWIGAESMILKGVTVGEGAIVAARSVVTKDVPPFTVVAGNPAKVVKKLKEV